MLSTIKKTELIVLEKTENLNVSIAIFKKEFYDSNLIILTVNKIILKQ